MKYAAIAAVLAVTLSAPAAAQTTMLNPTVNCEQWPKLRDSPAGRGIVLGFLSGMSLSYWIENSPIVGEHGLDPLAALSSVEEAFVWIDGYCARNRGDRLPQAMSALFHELEGRRIHTLGHTRR